MKANAKIILTNGKALYKFFENPEAVSKWMKDHFGEYISVETNFLKCWEV